MIDDARNAAPERTPARDTGAMLLAAGGLAAAFGAASCCALPLLFGSLGLGSAWLVTVASSAAPHRIALLIQRSPVCIAAPRRPRRCRPTPVSSFMTALGAASF